MAMPATSPRASTRSWSVTRDGLTLTGLLVVAAVPWVLNPYAPAIGYPRLELSGLVDTSLKILGGGFFLYAYIVHGRRKHRLDEKHLELQHDTTLNRHELAMNIDMGVETVPHGRGRFVRPVTFVHNVSTNQFCVPVVCLQVSSVPLEGLKSHASWENDKTYERVVTRNINAYSTMPGVKPQERESFTDWLYFDEEDIRTHPTVVIQVDVVGTKERGSFETKEARSEFMAWMKENGGTDKLIFASWSAEEVRGIKEARSNGQLWNGVDPNQLSLKRCLVSKPPGAKEYSRDYFQSAKWGDVLEETVMWDRYAIVSLIDGRVLAVGQSKSPDQSAE